MMNSSITQWIKYLDRIYEYLVYRFMVEKINLDDEFEHNSVDKISMDILEKIYLYDEFEHNSMNKIFR